MPPDRGFIEATIAEIENVVRLLRGLAARSRAEFTADELACFSSAYALIIAIEAVSNITAHLISVLSLASPQGMADSFAVLHQAGIVTDASLRDRLSEMVRFRNLLVHRYWRVDYARVHDILQQHVGDFGQFCQQVEAYLDKLDTIA